MTWKIATRCEGCQRKRPARYRTGCDRFLCDDCDTTFRTSGTLPDRFFDDDAPIATERRAIVGAFTPPPARRGR